MCPRMRCPFSSFTRKVALGRVSVISPCIWISFTLAMFVAAALPSEDQQGCVPLLLSRSSPGRESRSLEIGFLQQALVLVRHDVGLHLRHEVHGHDDDDQERSPAEV